MTRGELLHEHSVRYKEFEHGAIADSEWELIRRSVQLGNYQAIIVIDEVEQITGQRNEHRPPGN